MESSQILSSEWITQVVVRPIEAAEVPDLEWDGEFVHFRRVYADAYARVQRGLTAIWVARWAGFPGVLGQAFIQLNSDRRELADGENRAYLYSFRIRPQFRSAGLGTRFMQVIMEDLHQRGYRRLTLNVAKTNIRAQALYHRLGFLTTAHEPGIWSYQDHEGNWQHVEEPAWRMEKSL
jgi:ribosomal protein S18 acetylase RimI-like enzyme